MEPISRDIHLIPTSAPLANCYRKIKGLNQLDQERTKTMSPRLLADPKRPTASFLAQHCRQILRLGQRRSKAKEMQYVQVHRTDALDPIDN